LVYAVVVVEGMVMRILVVVKETTELMEEAKGRKSRRKRLGRTSWQLRWGGENPLLVLWFLLVKVGRGVIDGTYYLVGVCEMENENDQMADGIAIIEHPIISRQIRTPLDICFHSVITIRTVNTLNLKKEAMKKML
jgi:hypothetical protein